jgi:hypothetical protein
MTTEFHGKGPEGVGLSESRVRENLTHGSMRGNWKDRRPLFACSLLRFSNGGCLKRKGRMAMLGFKEFF